MEQEIFKPIKGYEGFYEVSNFGRVRSLNYKRTRGTKNMVTWAQSNGYVYVKFSNINNRVTKSVHRLVAEAFIPNFKNKAEVNHINGIKTDNRVENLEWVTRHENINHSFEIGLRGRGEKSHMFNRTGSLNSNSKKVINILNGKVYESASFAAKECGIKPKVLYSWLIGKRTNKSTLRYLTLKDACSL
jgi:hypothetical protein